MARKAGKAGFAARQEISSGILSRFRWGDSYTSLVLGLIVVVIAAVLVFSLGKNRQVKQTSSIQDGPVNREEKREDVAKKTKTQKVYIIKEGDDLWSISQEIYKSGFYWVEIAKANNLTNPGLIFSGNKLIIPEIKTQQATTQQVARTKQTERIKTNLITGNSYKAVEGDSLWDIAVRAYGDGYKWVEIAKQNNLANPDLIFSENVLKIPR